MKVTKLLAVGVAVAALGGCSSDAATTASPTTTTTSPAPTTTRASSPGTGAATSTPMASGAVNLSVTQAVRSELVDAGAALNGLTASDYVGLQAGMTYYAYDQATATYWAGAALSPSPASIQAQVSSQDDGSYLLFERPANGTWTARPVGLTGTSDGPPCPVAIPSEVLALWSWAPGTCRPTS